LDITKLRGGKVLWCGASWVKRLRFWLNWVEDWELVRVWYFSPEKNTRLLNLFQSTACKSASM